MKKSSKIIKNQKIFFDSNASVLRPVLSQPFFLQYANKEQTLGFKWLSDQKIILDYGCGTGTSINIFLEANSGASNQFIGVDISEDAISHSKNKYPNYRFIAIENNRIPQINECTVDGAYLLHVLHHSHEHKEIFQEVYKKLKVGGKFFLSDLSSNNLIISCMRRIFICAPNFIQQRFADDLVVDGAIPEKYKVNPKKVIDELKEVGFKISEVGYGHLALFCLGWIDRFIPLSRIRFIRRIYTMLEKIEQRLLRLDIFKNRSEVFYIKCIK